MRSPFARDGVGPIAVNNYTFFFTGEETWSDPATSPQFVCAVEYDSGP